jgi:hypothetical protein
MNYKFMSMIKEKGFAFAVRITHLYKVLTDNRKEYN